jgi:hypothetical protein
VVDIAKKRRALSIMINIDILCFPTDSAGHFIDERGLITISRNDIVWTKL